MRKRQSSTDTLRVALVWDSSAMRSQQVLSGLCQRADAQANLNLKRYDAMAVDFDLEVLKPLRAWKPHGLILRMDHGTRVDELRKLFPHVPIVATNRMPPGAADTMVLGNATEVAWVAWEHFQSQGVDSCAMFAPGPYVQSEVLTELFREVIPGAAVLQHPVTTAEMRAEPEGATRHHVGAWLSSLPKPVGVLTYAGDAGPYLSRVCREIGLKVPGEVQLIGCDDPDVCMECIPHLTTVIPTGELIGETAMDALIHHLTPAQATPAKELRVGGCTLTVRGSTGPASRPSRTIAKARDLILTRATKGLTTENLVQMSRQGRSTFYSQFRESTGSTPAKQLRERRIAAACRLLSGSDASISKIAEKCGFSSANYFAQVFRRETGVSPGGYRRTHQQGG